MSIKLGKKPLWQSDEHKAWQKPSNGAMSIKLGKKPAGSPMSIKLGKNVMNSPISIKLGKKLTTKSRRINKQNNALLTRRLRSGWNKLTWKLQQKRSIIQEQNWTVNLFWRLQTKNKLCILELLTCQITITQDILNPTGSWLTNVIVKFLCYRLIQNTCQERSIITLFRMMNTKSWDYRSWPWSNV